MGISIRRGARWRGDDAGLTMLGAAVGHPRWGYGKEGYAMPWLLMDVWAYIVEF